MICMRIRDKMIKPPTNPWKSKPYLASRKPFSQSCLYPRRIHSRIAYSISRSKQIGFSVFHTSSMKINQRLKAKKTRIRSTIMSSKYHQPIWLPPQIYLHLIRVTQLLINIYRRGWHYQNQSNEHYLCIGFVWHWVHPANGIFLCRSLNFE